MLPHLRRDRPQEVVILLLNPVRCEAELLQSAEQDEVFDGHFSVSTVSCGNHGPLSGSASDGTYTLLDRRPNGPTLAAPQLKHQRMLRLNGVHLCWQRKSLGMSRKYRLELASTFIRVLHTARCVFRFAPYKFDMFLRHNLRTPLAVSDCSTNPRQQRHKQSTS